MMRLAWIVLALLALNGGLFGLLLVLELRERRRINREIERVLADARSRVRRIVHHTDRGTLTITLWEESWPR